MKNSSIENAFENVAAAAALIRNSNHANHLMNQKNSSNYFDSSSNFKQVNSNLTEAAISLLNQSKNSNNSAAAAVAALIQQQQNYLSDSSEEDQPLNMALRVNNQLIRKLRQLMKNLNHVPEPLQAYIIPSCDIHQSEYIADCDKRREFLTGFTGSAGTAIVTSEECLLWTDGRYFDQAEKELHDGWRLMKAGQKGTPTQTEFLLKNLPSGSKIGVDAKLYSYSLYNTMNNSLNANGIQLVPFMSNLVDLLWTDKPNRPNQTINSLDLKFTGSTWQEKISKVREAMQAKEASVLVLSALDETAWLFNLRGSDIPYNPVFYAYTILTLDNIYLFVDEDQLSSSARKHLNLDSNKNNKQEEFMNNSSLEKSQDDLKVQIRPYESIKDAVALCEFFAWLEEEIPKGNQTEISAAKKLLELRKEQENFVQSSFETISSSGPNGATIHYTPTESSDRLLSVEEMYLCDSGAQYLDGTTDVTRTLHFGVPSENEKQFFTRVVKGHINLANCIFPEGAKGSQLDILARKALWEVGLDYLHGTGHGVGCYLNVHEGPIGISYASKPSEPGLKEGMILSNEPGYYEKDKFGIRIESLVVVSKKETQIDWLDNYHQKCREIVGNALKEQGKTAGYKWLLKETQPLAKSITASPSKSLGIKLTIWSSGDKQ
ncbi:hypothetical protein RND71_043316 [Anisodus tanguticus]|uniref:Uncharacterized protein n=1 Tax=Anisodus tanguticus TaxID=243964 RepID=A0AAE1QSA9_9SOLA|nr:hypothetical protein RND71_043316 [Anisodus tanguticus]